MTNRHFLSGVPAVLLAFVVVFAACETPTQQVEGTVNLPALEAPVVTAAAVKGGVHLEWSPILDASSYTVWRKAGAAGAIELNSGFPFQDPETGKWHYLDLVSDNNPLKAGTEYTYTVIAQARSSTITNSRSAEAAVTPAAADIPAKGAKLAAVSGVTLKLDPDAEEATVSWIIPPGEVPAQRYSVQLYRDGSYVGNDSVGFGETDSTVYWGSSSQNEGEYTARVTATDPNSYFTASDPAVSAAEKYEALFGAYDSVSASSSAAGIITDGALTNFYASISLSSITVKPGVTYTVERAPLNAGVAKDADYVPVTLLSKTGPTATALAGGDLTVDILGNLPLTTVYDRTLPITPGEYKYRIKAAKSGITRTKEASSPTTVDPRQAISAPPSLVFAAPTGTTTKTYKVTPSAAVTPKGALQAGDKVVVYYIKGDASGDLYETGPYAAKIEFTKDELEAAALGKDLDIPKADGDTAAYVQAYLVAADGTRVTAIGISTGGGVTGSGNYYNPSNVTYYTLDY
ncbi:MAG: hypothetical protein LBP80_10255 [Treponema sp.]|nr:hypothetical protein [Treponema sp.]